MNGLTDYITERPWADTITVWYVLVDEAYQRLIAKRGSPLRRSGPEPTFSDSEVITVSLIIETFFREHEELDYAFVSQYLRDMFPNLIDLDRFNVRRREWPDEVRRAMGRVRHRVETVFSTLTTAFNVQRPRGRSLDGHVVRIATCILAHTLCFFLA